MSASLKRKSTCVFCFGDSITEGNALPPELRHLRWTDRLERSTHGKWRIINLGKGGRPTDSVEEFKTEWDRYQPEPCSILILQLGTNDSRNLNGDCVPLAIQNLTSMIDYARSTVTEIRIVLIGPPNLNKSALGATRAIADDRIRNLKHLNSAYQKLANEKGLSFLSLYGVLTDPQLALDGVHPDEHGNDRIAKIFQTELDDLTLSNH